MKQKISPWILCVVLALAFESCDTPDDVVPPAFFKVQLNPDLIYMYNGGAPEGVRLDPLVNDSIKVDVSVSYSTPKFGTITFIQNEGWFYKPADDYVGSDDFTYTVCADDKCFSAAITMQVEAPFDPNNCTAQIVGETVETTKDQPIAIRIFDNDVVCPYAGTSINSPEKGTFNIYSYSGSFKNTVYVYYPPNGFVGTDRFMYKLFTSEGDLVAYCDVTIKE